MSKAVPIAILVAAALARPCASQTSIPLTVDAGVPLRLYLTKRVPIRLDEPVHAKLLDPVFAFDRAVVPAGSEISGRVVRLEPVTKMQRTKAILGGDFTPLHRAEVEFTDIALPSGQHVAVNTVGSVGLGTIYSPPRPKKAGKAGASATHGGVLGTGKSTIESQINSTINSRTRGIADIVRAPNRKEKIEEYLWSRLPYHPQWVRNGTRFDAELAAPMQFGSTVLKPEELSQMGSQPPPDSIVHARLTTPLDSARAEQGDKVEAILSQPLFSAERKLLLPAGTRLTGKVTVAHAARWFHRGGRLRFSFEGVDIPPELHPVLATTAPAPEFRTVATLKNAEASGKVEIKVDDEGSVKTVEHKTRFLAPALALLVASRSMDNDTGKAQSAGGTANGNVGGRTMGGISGFGVFGAAAAQISPSVASALGLYGLGWSVYSTIVSRGAEVEFEKNAALDIRFGARPPELSSPAASRFSGTH